MIPRNPEVREQLNHARNLHRRAQVVTYATSFGVITIFLLLDPDHRLARGLFAAATSLFHAIIK